VRSTADDKRPCRSVKRELVRVTGEDSVVRWDGTSNRDALRKIAIENGCDPVWSVTWREWRCACVDELHFGDRECSIISAESAQRKR
jgi:hypothetical protein